MKSSLLHRLFIPSHHNNYRAKALHISSLTVYLIGAVILSFSFSNKSFLPAGAVLGIAQNMSADKLYELTNQQRVTSGLSTFALNSQLSTAAQEKCNKMFADNFWAHYAPDGTTPWFFISQAGYKYETAGENLAKDFNDSNSVVNAWMASPTHAANILNSKYQDIGFAVCNGTLTGSETTLVVQMFGKPIGSSSLADNSLRTVAVQAKEVELLQSEISLRETARQQPTPTSQILLTTLQPKTIGSSLQAATHKPTMIASLAKSLPKTATLVFFGMLLVTLLFDFYYAYKLKAYRVVGKHLAHFIFVTFILISLLIAARGVIL